MPWLLLLLCLLLPLPLLLGCIDGVEGNVVEDARASEDVEAVIWAGAVWAEGMATSFSLRAIAPATTVHVGEGGRQAPVIVLGHGALQGPISSRDVGGSTSGGRCSPPPPTLAVCGDHAAGGLSHVEIPILPAGASPPRSGRPRFAAVGGCSHCEEHRWRPWCSAAQGVQASARRHQYALVAFAPHRQQSGAVRRETADAVITLQTDSSSASSPTAVVVMSALFFSVSLVFVFVVV